MDPWLESPYIWGDFHQSFAGAIRAQLNRRLTKPYYARLEARPDVGIVEDEDAVASRFSNEPGKHVYVEIRDASRDHQLVTLVEIVSPSNKRKGKDRRSYLRKQREVLSSEANLIEIDLLRAGKRLFASTDIEASLEMVSKRVDYVVVISRGWKRDDLSSSFELFAISINELLPCIPLPLTKDRPEIPVDLQRLFDEAYDTGPYTDGAVNYDEAPDPPLPAEFAVWADERLRKAGMIA
jgi:hypothetical protein